MLISLLRRMNACDFHRAFAMIQNSLSISLFFLIRNTSEMQYPEDLFLTLTENRS